jgi:transcription-repair coupling factor (superfamily II helicase)
MAEAVLQKDAPGGLQRLTRLLESRPGFADCTNALRENRAAHFDSVWGSAAALLAASLLEQTDRPLVVVCTDQKRLDDFADELESFSELKPLCFSSYDLSAEDPTREIEFGQRIGLLKKLAAGVATPLILTHAVGLMQRCPSQTAIQSGSRIFVRGQTLDVEDLKQWLTANRFHHTSGVELPGEFSIRGGIIDIFAPDWDVPARIELFGDQIESIRQVNLRTQRSERTVEQIEVTVVSKLGEHSNCLFDFLPTDSWLLLLEPGEIQMQGDQFLKLTAQPAAFLSIAQLQQRWSHFGVALAERLAAGNEKPYCNLQAETIGNFDGDISEIRAALDSVGEGHEVFVVPRTVGEIERLNEIFLTSRLGSLRKLQYPVGFVHEGFRLIPDKVIVIGVDQLFRRGELRRASRRRLGKAIDSFLDLREGDLVVHLAHGIARFRGLRMLDKDGALAEHLELEFHGGTKIYVPASKIDLVQKYIGGSKTKPILGRIGGKAWVKQKEAAKSAVTDLAAEMLEIQASRASRPGIPFREDTEWQHEFERSFPYRETNDQVTAINDIKRDMLQAKPMDRLLCGDVGFGKTEVAMRAAFKAVESGYQVAVMCPTTVLCEQHYKTFCDRMSEFPFEIAKLSRFCTAKENRETIKKIKAGRVDIAIGTHRIASKDVKFYNLGLVLIDEEQRFGVEVKERLKALRTSVDLLTMSATPIPRTLHMSLVGVRDISNLETPPEARMAVETRVTRYDEELIRQAIIRELNRGGQIYFVHNRVNDIQQVRQKLECLVPEAKIGVGHGQMPEGELEKVMTDFIGGRFDLLLATTIVESGLDIPNANTIFIDEAYRYGLSDLHQLRGRVGRFKNRAYCYLLIEGRKHLNPTAAKRLHAIQQHSELGAGFAISMRDLEIRGAGNLLGTEQSGHIAAIGYELYCQMLESAVRQLKQMPQRLSIDVDIDLPCEAYLPDEYVWDKRTKIDLYRRMTRFESFDQIVQLRDEMRDRFGPLPRPAKRMLSLARLRLEAVVWQIRAISLEDHYLVFRYSDRRRIQQLADQSDKKLRIVDGQSAYVTLKKGPVPPDALLKAVKSILQPKR